MKKYIKSMFLVVIFSFLGLYFFYSNGYAENKVRKEQEMMETLILEYEEDLKNGVDVSQKDYSIKKTDYSNHYSRFTLRISNKIEKVIDNGIKYLFKKVSDMVNE